MVWQKLSDKGTLLLAFIIGLSLGGTFFSLFSAIVSFSLFPVIALGLSAWCLHRCYQNRTMPKGLPALAAAFFLLGVLCYSAVIRAEYPVIGSNFVPVILMVVVIFWIGLRIKKNQG